MRLRLQELMDARGWSAYHLAKAAAEYGVSEQAIYRLVRSRGRPKRLDVRVLSALLHVFDVEVDELLVVEPVKRRR